MGQSLRDYLQNLYQKEKLIEIPDCSLMDIPNLIFTYRKKVETFWVKQVKDYPGGFLFNLLSSREHFCKVLGCNREQIWQAYLAYLAHPIKPVLISAGSVQEVKYIGGEVDLRKLPIVKYNSRDASPYITAGIVLAKDPETGIRNASIHRLQVQGEKRLGIRLEPGSHLELIRQKAQRIGKKVEVVVAVGNHPAEIIAAVSRTEFGRDELEIAGAIRGESLELVQCFTIDAEVPAQAEIALEGYMNPGELALEGPFGDFMGYYVPPSENPVIHLTAITHREHPILQVIRAGSVEDSLLLGLSHEAAIFKRLKSEGIDVVGVNLSPMVFNGAIALSPKSKEEVRRALEIALEQVPWLKYCVAVNPDVDIFDWEDVLWAAATRSSPAQAVIFKDARGFARDPFGLHKAKLILDATVLEMMAKSFERARP